MRRRSLAGLKRWRDGVPATAGQVVLSIAFLADQARLAVDATARTLVRHFVTRRHLLEWETAASTERRLGTGLSTSSRHVAGAGPGRGRSPWWSPWSIRRRSAAAAPVLAAWLVLARGRLLGQPAAPVASPR